IERETPDEPQLDFFRGNLARTLMFRGKYGEARALLEKALSGFAACDGEKSLGYAFQLFRLARVEFAAGNVDQSESLLRDAAPPLDPLLPAAHPLRAQLAAMRGMIAKSRNDLATAQSAFEAAEQLQASIRDGDPVSLAIIRARLAGVLVARGDLPGA